MNQYTNAVGRLNDRIEQHKTRAREGLPTKAEITQLVALATIAERLEALVEAVKAQTKATYSQGGP